MLRGSNRTIIERWKGDILVSLREVYDGSPIDDYHYAVSADNWDTFEELDDFSTHDINEAYAAFNRMVNQFQEAA